MLIIILHKHRHIGEFYVYISTLHLYDSVRSTNAKQSEKEKQIMRGQTDMHLKGEKEIRITETTPE